MIAASNSPLSEPRDEEHEQQRMCDELDRELGEGAERMAGDGDGKAGHQRHERRRAARAEAQARPADNRERR